MAVGWGHLGEQELRMHTTNPEPKPVNTSCRCAKSSTSPGRRTPHNKKVHLLGQQVGRVLVGQPVGVDGVELLQPPRAADAPLERHVSVAQQVGAVHDQVLALVCGVPGATQLAHTEGLVLHRAVCKPALALLRWQEKRLPMRGKAQVGEHKSTAARRAMAICTYPAAGCGFMRRRSPILSGLIATYMTRRSVGGRPTGNSVHRPPGKPGRLLRHD